MPCVYVHISGTMALGTKQGFQEIPMTWATVIIVALLVGLQVFFAVRERKTRNDEGYRLFLLADAAMAYMKAVSLEEKVRIDAQAKQYDVQLSYLRDTMAREEHASQPKVSVATKYLQTEAGDKIKADEYEVLA